MGVSTKVLSREPSLITVVCPNKHPPPSENLAYWGGGALLHFGVIVLDCSENRKEREGGGAYSKIA